MKALRYLILILTAGLLLPPALPAQDAATKAKMAEIRKAYARAMQFEKDGKTGPKKNYQTFHRVQTDPNGESWESEMDFIVDPNGYIEELDLYYPTLCLVRESGKDFTQEFLYDPDGRLLFVFTRNDYDDDGKVLEERYYYGDEGAFWKIVKEVDGKTGKVLSEKADRAEEADGTALFMYRVAADHYSAFQALNTIYD